MAYKIKEFDRTPLQNSDFYKGLKKSTGPNGTPAKPWVDRMMDSYDPAQKSRIAEKQKKVVIDTESPRFVDDQIKTIIDNVEKANPSPKKDRPKPKPRTTSQSPRLNSQVTPGKWTTK